MPIQILPITPPDIPSAIHCIQLAFDEDPYNQWVFDRTTPGAFNVERNFYSLKAKMEWGIRNALFYVAKETPPLGSDPSDSGEPYKLPHDPNKVLGVSMWVPPHQQDASTTWSEWLDEYFLYLKQSVNLIWYLGRGGLRTNRYYIWKQQQSLAQQALWTDPNGYYFCNIITVLPGQQGKGIGRKLFEAVMDKADREGRRCYLESSRETPNVGIYERMGFELRRKMLCKDDRDGGDKGCDLFCMIREPKTRG